MDEKTLRHIAETIELAQPVFEKVTPEIDATPVWSILRIEAEYGKYQILVTELLRDEFRKYRYYVMRDAWVDEGFDNAPDPRAVNFQYGKIGEEHAGEKIPHLHQEDKTLLSEFNELMASVDLAQGVKGNY